MNYETSIRMLKEARNSLKIGEEKILDVVQQIFKERGRQSLIKVSFNSARKTLALEWNKLVRELADQYGVEIMDNLFVARVRERIAYLLCFIDGEFDEGHNNEALADQLLPIIELKTKEDVVDLDMPIPLLRESKMDKKPDKKGTVSFSRIPGTVFDFYAEDDGKSPTHKNNGPSFLLDWKGTCNTPRDIVLALYNRLTRIKMTFADGSVVDMPCFIKTSVDYVEEVHFLRCFMGFMAPDDVVEGKTWDDVLKEEL